MRSLRPFTLSAAIAVIPVAGGLLLLSGCGPDSREVNAPPPSQNPSQVSSAGSVSAQGASASMGATSAEAFRKDLVAGQQQVDKSLAALRTLTDPTTTDLRAAYDNYSNQLARMNEHADTIRREAEAMRTSRAEYFAQWEGKVSDIENPTIRATAEAKRAKLRQSHERISMATVQVRDAYESFTRDLQDVRKFLGGELSKQSVSMLGDVQRKATQSGGTVKEKIGVIIAELDAIEAARQ